MPLSELQRQAFRIMTNEEPGSCLINGHAGCGKTYVAIEAIKALFNRNKTILVCCPTHQAKEQFISKLPINLLYNNKLEITTVASYLAQYPLIMPTGEMFFRRGDETSSDHDLIIVDEVSMVSQYEMECFINGANKVVFLGDYAQLRPVMKKQGDLYTQIPTITLTEQHRNAGHILQLCGRLRTEFVQPRETTEDQSIRIYDNHDSMLERFVNQLAEAERPYDIAYLAYRNAVVDSIKQYAHYALYGEVDFCNGQYLRLDETCKVGNNGSIVLINNIEQYVYQTMSGDNIHCYKVHAKNINTNFEGNILILTIPNQRLLSDKIDSLIFKSHELYKRKKWSDLKETQLQLKELRNTFVLHSSPFVQTVHKSQGRSIPYVYVNNEDIQSGNDRRRLMYVACSRAQLQLNLIKV